LQALIMYPPRWFRLRSGKSRENQLAHATIQG
jgi:hypothetical protein